MSRQTRFSGWLGVLAATALLVVPALVGAQEQVVVAFSEMGVQGGVQTFPGGQISALKFDVDFILGKESDGFVLGGREGDDFSIETSIAMVPGGLPPQFSDNIPDDQIQNALLLNIVVKGDCFQGKNRRYRLALRDPKSLAGCVVTTLSMPGMNLPGIDGLLQSMEVDLWRLGLPHRWRMRSTARFTTPLFGYPVAGFGPGSWTGLALGDDRGRVGTSTISFGGRMRSGRDDVSDERNED